MFSTLKHCDNRSTTARITHDSKQLNIFYKLLDLLLSIIPKATGENETTISEMVYSNQCNLKKIPNYTDKSIPGAIKRKQVGK